MLHTLSELRRMSIAATDGEIGRIKDAYFDDHEWTVRYIIVDPGPWLAGRRVQITPWSIRGIDWVARRISLAVTRDQIRNSPDIDADPPVSRQHEIAYFEYFGYPQYWTGPLLWGEVPFPDVRTLSDALPESDRPVPRGDPHLRSANEVHGYRIEAVDGSIGHVDDFLFDDQGWSLRYLVVDTRNWLPGRHVVIATEWVQRVSWEERKAHVALTMDEVRASPEYDPESFTHGAEQALHRHYRPPGSQHASHEETR